MLFILSLAGLAHQRSAKAGNIAGKIGMVIALAATVALSLLESDQNAAVTAGLIAAALLIGAVIGTRVGPPGRDDAHARDDRDPAQFRRVWRRSWSASTPT